MKRVGITTCAALLALTALYLALGQVPASAERAGPAGAEKIVPLFNSETKLEPATIEDTPTALITRVADRVRDRHAREWMFHAYAHYLAFYWEHRTVSIEVVDRVAKGGDS